MKKILLFAICIINLVIVPKAIAVVQQTFDLNPGWNAIYLEVEPSSNKWVDILNGVNVSSVWLWHPTTSSVEFIQDPSELVPRQDGWLAYLSNEPSFLTNLYIAQGGKSYLVKLDEPQATTLTISGTPILPKIQWKPNSFNLVGFHLDPGNEPFFGTFFDVSPTHKDQEIYRLGSTGNWEKLQTPLTTRMKHGEAFWIFCEGSSEFIGPLVVELEQGNGLEFGKNLLEQKIKFRNLVPNNPLSVNVTGDISLSHYVNPETQNDAPNSVGWQPLNSIQINASADNDTELRLGVNRNQMGTNSSSQFTMLSKTEAATNSLLEVKDGQGMRIQIPVNAEKTDYSGLWVGSVTVNKVQDPGDDRAPKSTNGEFQFRIIVHVGTDGSTKLVKEVTQMWDPNANRLVLVSDYSQLSNYEGVAMVNSQPVGRRVSTVNFGFDGARIMSGSFGSTLAIGLTIEPDNPTNPFLHRYHPDHNNLDERHDNFVEEAYKVIRDITLDFTLSDPEFPEGALIGWGDKDIGGVYSETFGGLHKDNITVEGTFRLHKVSSIGELI